MEKKLYKYYKLDRFDDLLDVRLDPIFYNGPQIRKNRDDVQGYMLLFDNTLYITFRGSNDIQDIMFCTDIRRKHLGNNIYIHKGYYDQFKAIEADITSDILKISNSYHIDKIVFSGHSLGGSLAMIAAPYYSTLFRGNKDIACHTFGSTVVGNSQFIDWFNANVQEHYRVNADKDIVPLIPIHETYIHSSHCIKICENYISNEDDYKNDCLAFLNYIKNKPRMLNDVNSFHACQRYMDILYKIFKKCSYSNKDSLDLDEITTEEVPSQHSD
jgi:hypothetical protein